MPDTVRRMKTTIDLPDALAREAKELAHRHGVSLRELVVEGLRSEVARRSAAPTTMDFVFPTVGGKGLAVELDPASVIAASYGLPV